MEERQSIQQQLEKARQALQVLEQQVAQFGPLHVPVYKKLELEKKRKEVARLEARRKALLADTRCPYRGLEPFEAQHAEFYFGREAMLERLVTRVREGTFVAVVGPSGCGKSSLVRAGLVTVLRQGALPGGEVLWPQPRGDVAIFRPGRDPLRSLAASLMRWLEPGASEVERLAEARKLADHLRQGTLPMADVVAGLREKQPDIAPFVLVADQFEELYTERQDEALRRAFVEALLAAAREGIKVVLTLRADFYGRALADPRLGEAVDGGLVNVLPMREEELRAAIEKPAHKMGREFEPGLVDRILEDVVGEPGNLPLFEFALTELWQRQTAEGVLTHADYEAIGQVEGAIARRAEAEYDRLDEEEQRLARRVFLRLVAPGEGTEDTRRRATLAELGKEARPVVKALADARLVTTGRDEATGQETVEVAHEALIQGWERLRRWVDEDREFLTWRKRLETALREWQRLEGDEGVLLRGSRLAEAERWLAEREADLSADERNFIKTSTARAKRVRELTVSGVVFAFLVVSLLALLAWWQRGEAKARQKIATSRELAAAAMNQLEVDPERSILLAMEAMRAAHTFEAEDALRRALLTSHLRSTLRGHEAWVNSAAFSPDGHWVVTASWDNTARVWEAATGRELAVLRGHEGPVSSAAFSPDGRWVVTASWDNTARVWEATTGEELGVLRGHKDGVRSAAFSPDGRWVVTASDDGTARVWEATTGRELGELQHKAEVWSAAFSPNGRWVVTASDDGTARVWELTTGKELTVLQGHGGLVESATFSPNGQWVATASWDGTARVWEAATGEELVVLRGHEGPVNSAAFSPDGQWVVTASVDKTARVWEVAVGKEVAMLHGHEGRVLSVAFSPDGRWAVTASDDGTARVWEAATGRELAVLRGHEGWVRSAVFSPDGRWVVTASNDNTARMWEAATGRELAVLRRHEGPVSSAAFSPDGRWVVTASWDNTARVWEATTGEELGALRGHKDGVRSAAFSPDGRWVVTASGDDTARVWEAATGKELAVLRGHEDGVNSAAFSPDGQWVVTASVDKTARVWEVATGKELAVLHGHEEVVNSAAFSPDGRWVVTASVDKTARVWEMATGREVAVLRGHEDVVNSARFSPDGRLVMTASWDGTARVWEAATGREVSVLRGHKGGVYSAVFSPEGRWAATASIDGTARIYAVHIGDLMELAQQRVTRKLTCQERVQYLHEELECGR